MNSVFNQTRLRLGCPRALLSLLFLLLLYFFFVSQYKRNNFCIKWCGNKLVELAIMWRMYSIIAYTAQGTHTQPSLQYSILTTCNFTPTCVLHFCQSIYGRNLRLKVEQTLVLLLFLL